MDPVFDSVLLASDFSVFLELSCFFSELCGAELSSAEFSFFRSVQPENAKTDVSIKAVAAKRTFLNFIAFPPYFCIIVSFVS